MRIETMALAAGRLTSHCDWDWFDRTLEGYKAGIPLDEIDKHVQILLEDERGYLEILIEEKRPALAKNLASKQESKSRHFKTLRDCEQLMRFDEASTSCVVELLV